MYLALFLSGKGVCFGLGNLVVDVVIRVGVG